MKNLGFAMIPRAHVILATSFVFVEMASLAFALPSTLVNNGPSDNRVDIIFLGDGYSAIDHQAGTYETHIQGMLDHMFSGFRSDPFPRYEKFFNVHAIYNTSQQSGADIPAQSIFKNTYFDASYETPSSGGSDRLILIDEALANVTRDIHLASTNITSELQLMTVNHTKYGGSGGSPALPPGDRWAVFAGGNVSAAEIGLHELAHSFVDLADEYGGFTTPYTGAEPTEANVTTNPSGAKWSHWAGFDDPRSSNLDINTYEGGRYYNQGIYRPSLDSKMRSVGLLGDERWFDAVSREELIQRIYSYVDPLDDWKNDSSPVFDQDLWVEVVDPDVIKVEWYVDHSLVPGANGETFNPLDYGFGGGTYEVAAFAFDEVVDHALTGDSLDLVREDTQNLQQLIEWTLTVSQPGDFEQDGDVDVSDYELWRAKFGTSSPSWWGNRNGIVDAADYTIWLDNYTGSQRSAGSAVPEPASLALGFLALISCNCSLRRRILE